MKLTPEGLRFERYARSVRLAWNLACEDVGLPARFRRRLRIAMQIQLADRLVDGWGLVLKRLLPDTALEIDSDYSKDMTEDLLSARSRSPSSTTRSAGPSWWSSTSWTSPS